MKEITKEVKDCLLSIGYPIQEKRHYLGCAERFVRVSAEIDVLNMNDGRSK